MPDVAGFAAPSIRLAVEADVEAIRSIERRAGELFRDAGLPEIADDEPMPTAALLAYVAGGRAWVAAEAEQADVPVACLLIDVIDGCAHVELVAVAPSHQRRGLGRLLLDVAGEWAGTQQLSWVTLTTFRDIPWNAPYYERLGFSVVPTSELTPGITALVATEAAHGLDPGTRVVMRRPAS